MMILCSSSLGPTGHWYQCCVRINQGKPLLRLDPSLLRNRCIPMPESAGSECTAASTNQQTSTVLKDQLKVLA